MRVIRVRHSDGWSLYFFRKDDAIWVLERYETRCSLYPSICHKDLASVNKYYSGVYGATPIDTYNGKSYIPDDFWESLLRSKIATD